MALAVKRARLIVTLSESSYLSLLSTLEPAPLRTFTGILWNNFTFDIMRVTSITLFTLIAPSLSLAATGVRNRPLIPKPPPFVPIDIDPIPPVDFRPPHNALPTLPKWPSLGPTPDPFNPNRGNSESKPTKDNDEGVDPPRAPEKPGDGPDEDDEKGTATRPVTVQPVTRSVEPFTGTTTETTTTTTTPKPESAMAGARYGEVEKNFVMVVVVGAVVGMIV